jgi:hypothetical protein
VEESLLSQPTKCEKLGEREREKVVENETVASKREEEIGGKAKMVASARVKIFLIFFDFPSIPA